MTTIRTLDGTTVTPRRRSTDADHITITAADAEAIASMLHAIYSSGPQGIRWATGEKARAALVADRLDAALVEATRPEAVTS